MKIRFLIYLIDSEGAYFRGRLSLEVNEKLTDEDYERMRKEFIRVGETCIKKHYRNQQTQHMDIRFLGERFLPQPEIFIYDYYVRGKRVSIIYRHIGPIAYWLSKILAPFV